MTYEEILAEADVSTKNSGLGQIIDATGATVCFFFYCRVCGPRSW